ncbi:MAG: glycosyltransferase family 4 protein [Chloroflexota bacterium]|nr:glycosyltransferase family 4 protein [Chloroflexota bacterium]
MSARLLMLSGDRDVTTGRRGPFHTTLEGLAEEFDRIDVLAPRAKGARTVTPFPGVTVEPSPVSRLRQSAWMRRRGADLLRRYGHGLIVSHDYGIFASGRAAARLSRRCRAPYVSEIHHVPGHPRPAQWWEPLAQLVYRAYVTRVARQAVAIRVVNRREVPNLLERWGVPAERILVLPSAYIDRDVFAPGDLVKNFTLGFVGRLVANKNLGYVIRVFATIASKNSRARFVMAGQGPGLDPVRRSLDRSGILGRVTFVDWLDSPADLADLYRRMSALIAPSLSEGGPRVCLEAMACGTPVFATPVGVMPETIQHGKNGWLLPWDTKAGGALVSDALSDPEKLRLAGRLARATTAEFEKSNVLGAYASAYRRIAERDRP